MNTSAIALPLSSDDISMASRLGLTYRTELHERMSGGCFDAEITLEIFCGDECLFEDSYGCLSFAGYHDLDAWDSALNKAAQDFRDVMADLKGEAV